MRHWWSFLTTSRLSGNLSEPTNRGGRMGYWWNFLTKSRLSSNSSKSTNMSNVMSNILKHENSVAFKITHGYVRQDFVDGQCVGQKFIAGDQVDWENEVGDLIKVPDYEAYQPFDMVQPVIEIPVIGKLRDDGQVEFKESKSTICMESGMETRKHQDAPTREIDTPFGLMVAVVTAYDHIYLKPPGVTQLRVNRVDMHATMHLRNYVDGGGFAPDQGADRKSGEPWNTVYATCAGGVEVSMAAKKKIWTTLPGVVNEWLKSQGELLNDARRVQLNNDIMRKEGEVEEAKDKLAKLQEELRQIQEHEAKL